MWHPIDILQVAELYMTALVTRLRCCKQAEMKLLAGTETAECVKMRRPFKYSATIFKTAERRPGNFAMKGESEVWGT